MDELIRNYEQKSCIESNDKLAKKEKHKSDKFYCIL